jgi:L-fuculose-phosphate aldolase
MNFEREKGSIIYWAKQLGQTGLAIASSGNISQRPVNDHVLISAHNAYLGQLNDHDIVLVDRDGKVVEGDKKPSSETKLHLGIYKKFFDIKVVIHAHAPFSTAFFHYFDKLDIFNYETELCLGDVPVIPQNSFNVIDIEPVLAALEANNIVILKNHGVLAIGRNFRQAFGLIELLEEQARINMMIRSGSVKSPKEKAAKKIKKSGKGVNLFSKEHLKKIKDLANKGSAIRTLLKQCGLKGRVVFQFRGTNQGTTFTFDGAKLNAIDNNPLGDLVIVGDGEIFAGIFSGRINLFTAIFQGKVEFRGEHSLLANWYPALKEVMLAWQTVAVK